MALTVDQIGEQENQENEKKEFIEYMDGVPDNKEEKSDTEIKPFLNGHCNNIVPKVHNENNNQVENVRQENTSSRARCFKHKIFHILLGVIFGCMICTGYMIWHFVSRHSQNSSQESNQSPVSQSLAVEYTQSTTGTNQRLLYPIDTKNVTSRRLLYVGILTLDLYLNTRAASCNRTWAQNPGIDKVEYFAQIEVNSPNYIRDDVVKMNDIEGPDAFHNKKTFRMLQSMCDRHRDDFEWFLRVPDDVYVRVDTLRELLTSLDANHMYYLGHADSGWEELDRFYLEGRTFCLGGPGVILSRKTLNGICPYVAHCEQEFSQTSGDIELARCLHKYLGIECMDAPKIKEHFYDSYQDNQLHLAEEFLEKSSAISLHPIKYDYLMDAVHRTALGEKLDHISQKLSSLRSMKYFLSDKNNGNVSSLDVVIQRGSHIKQPVDMFTGDNLAISGKSCSVANNLTGTIKSALNNAVRLTNISCRFGDLLECPSVVDTMYQQTNITSIYNVRLHCYSVLNWNNHFIASAEVAKPRGKCQVKRTKSRALAKKLVVFLHVYVIDAELIKYLVTWKKLMQHYVSDDVLLVFLLFQDTVPSLNNAYLYDFLFDLTDWSKESDLKIKVHKFYKDDHIQRIHRVVLKHLDNTFKDSVILLTFPAVQFDKAFLTKCKILVRAERQIYWPYSRKPYIASDTQTLSPNAESWTQLMAPVCIHSQDLLATTKQAMSGKTRSRHKAMKYVRSLDLNIHLKLWG